MWVKNECQYIPEWIEFHLMQGVDHFILYDDDSEEDMNEILAPYIEQNILEIRKIPNKLDPPAKTGIANSKAFWIMDYCIVEQRGKTEWAFFHAVDEFLFIPDGRSLTEFLREYHHIGCLSVEWEQFSSDGHISQPKGLVIENYTKTFEDEKHHVKTIFRPNVTEHSNGTTHSVVLNNGFFPINERYYPLFYSFNDNDPGFEKIKLHHYGIKSKKEFIEKQEKGYLDLPGINVMNLIGQTWYDKELSDIKRSRCEDLLKFSSPVREKILKRYAGREPLLEGILH
jgi:hypothetical protein